MYEVLSNTDAPDDLGSLFTQIIKLVPWKYAIFIFMGFMIINTTTFIDRFLSQWDGAVEMRAPTEKGLLIQNIILCVALMAFGVFTNSGLV